MTVLAMSAAEITRFGIFAPAEQPDADKIDRRRASTPQLKRGTRLSSEKLIQPGLGEYV